MELMHNLVFKIITETQASPYVPGLYRVLFVEPKFDEAVCVRITEEKGCASTRTHHPPQKIAQPKRKKTRAPLRGEPIWFSKSKLEQLRDEKLVFQAELEREAVYLSPLKKAKDQKLFARRRIAMSGFLNPENLKQQITMHRGISGLVRIAMDTAYVSRSFVYQQWSTLCKLGFDQISLRPRCDRCGAPGVTRPCDPNGRKKPGRKTKKQVVAAATGGDTAPEQPGISTEWRMKILAADMQIGTEVKPAMPARVNHVLHSSFIKRYRIEGHELVEVTLEKGSYPTKRQIRRVLQTDIPELQRLLNSTTAGHFKRSMRGLTARNWKSVGGPGHQWAIDSTLADVYLRSSVNRAWIVGRPIVYIVVDVWSTAVMGFYVCLTGPSWSTAKIALFNSASAPSLIGELWGYQPVLSLNPTPTLSHELLCDRGEYLSKAASSSAFHLRLDLAYTPPYRPDLKGLVEVLHRIVKDKQFMFVPGAINARRVEFDLRKSQPAQSAMTVREYVQYLHIIFATYNLTANRVNRLDAHMIGMGVFPSPAGLWHFGHRMGIGFTRHLPQDDLITTLLQSEIAKVGPSSVEFAGRGYMSPIVQSEQWTTLARNRGKWPIPISYYPGSIQRIWTPHQKHDGLLQLDISDQANASAELTFDEVADTNALCLIESSDIEHARILQELKSLESTRTLIDTAVQRTKEAERRERGATPSMTEARVIEVASYSANAPSEAKAQAHIRDEAEEAYAQLLSSLLHSTDAKEDTRSEA